MGTITTIAEQSTQIAAPRVVHSVDRRWQAVSLRREGKTYERIGVIMGVTKQTAWKLVVDALEERRRELAESVDDVRMIAVDRLDRQTMILMKRLADPENPDPEKTSNALIKIEERRAAMLGLDAPKDFRITPGSSNAIPAGGDIDVSKLSTEQLRELERIQTAYDALVLASKPVELPPGGPVAVVEPEPKT